MLLKIWNYIRGYVMIEVSGFSVERFLNLAVHKGVYVWDVNKSSAKVTMKVSIKGFKLLRTCAKKTKCKIKIIKKTGTPFFIFRYRKRSVFIFGIGFFIFFLYFLSTFIWLVDVSGNERILTDELLAYCTENGLKTGGSKNGIDTDELRRKLMKKFPDISWVHIDIKGTKATIRLTEIIPKQQLTDRSTPADIVAAKDGLITSIVTSAGTPLVRQDDVVQEGSVLVSGKLTIGTEDTGISTRYVHASAEVRAKLYYDISFPVLKNYMEKRYTQNEKKYYSFILFDREINFFNPSITFTNYDKIISMNQFSFGEDYPLPIILVTTVYKEYNAIEKERTYEQMVELADRMLTGRIIREFDFESDIVDKKIELTESDYGLYVEALITTIERIDEVRAIEEEQQNGTNTEGNTNT